MERPGRHGAPVLLAGQGDGCRADHDADLAARGRALLQREGEVGADLQLIRPEGIIRLQRVEVATDGAFAGGAPSVTQLGSNDTPPIRVKSYTPVFGA